jgi:excisionase family DNA binding protein
MPTNSPFQWMLDRQLSNRLQCEPSYSLREAAKIVGLTKKRIYELCVAGRINAYRPHARGFWRIRQSEIERLLKTETWHPKEEQENQ